MKYLALIFAAYNARIMQKLEHGPYSKQPRAPFYHQHLSNSHFRQVAQPLIQASSSPATAHLRTTKDSVPKTK